MMSNNIKLDLADAIYRCIQAKDLDEKTKKEDFFIECLIELMFIKKIEYLIIRKSYIIILEAENIKFHFWIAEIPEIIQKTEYIDYLCRELVLKFYFS